VIRLTEEKGLITQMVLA